MSFLKNRWFKLFNFPKSKRFFVLLTLSLLLSSFLGAKIPFYIQDLQLQYLKNDLFFETLVQLSIIFFTVYLNRVFFGIVVHKYVRLLMQNARYLCYRKWLCAHDVVGERENLNDRYPQGEVISRIINDTEVVRELITSGTFGIFIDVFFVISYLVSFISLSPEMGVFLTFSEVTMIFILIWASKYMRQVFLDTRKSRGHMYNAVADISGGYREMYYTDNGSYASKRTKPVFQDFLQKILTANIWDAAYYSVAESLFPILLLLVVLFFPFTSVLTASLILVLVDLIQRSISPIKDVSGKIANIQRASSGFVRMGSFIDHLDSLPQSHEDDKHTPIKFREFKFSLEKFSYFNKKNREEFSLKNIHFSASSGQLIGIIGLSGSGKSTLLNILAANITPDEYQIEFFDENGKLTAKLDEGSENLSSYRSNVSLVSQDSHIFSEPLYTNISLNLKPKEEFELFWNEILERIPYLKSWNIDKEKALNPDEISLGQAQLICALRSCFLQRPIVLFDEISSSLDSELEKALSTLVALIQKQSLTFVVAHRIETVIGADKLILLDKGELASFDTHQNLLKGSELYKEFFK
ncbi:ABC transporter ATP-binding protein/permease [bacterium]|nr:ABC transporter ATP-binding protein/permease [bacterium]